MPELPLTIEGCHLVINDMHTLIQSLQQEIEVLKGSARQNSENSHRPPSSDGLTKKPALARAVGGKVGGQKGHFGRTLKMVDTPDFVVTHFPELCEACGADLSALPMSVYERRQA